MKKFFDVYYDLLQQFKSINMTYKYVELLKEKKNLILTGAPGTGKTHLAKEIAKQIIEENGTEEQIGFVQFHPSYDYTDFVEGLRPTKPDANGTIGFELKDGIFKVFCNKANKNLIDSKKNPEQINSDRRFEVAYERYIDQIRNGEIQELPLYSENYTMSIVSVSDNDNILLKTKNPDSTRVYTVSYNRLKKLSEVYTSIEKLEGISNIYNAMTEVIGGCYSSAYWATLHYIYSNYYNTNVQPSESPIQEKKYVFIIDEINRGEISKIFGELFFSIDPGYRGKKGAVKTQYANMHDDPDEMFYIPENVYIIGTMNDIDRSVESFDFAMRRRFTWKEITAQDSMENMKLSEEDKKRLTNLNNKISEIDGLNSSYHIGGAYLLNFDGEDKYKKIWELRIEPLLIEYLRGFPEANEKLNDLRNSFLQVNQNESSGQ
ncbi:McrB family protein [Ornithobacterium rhinotracheale]|uniref:McrB family protein n=2 Tax=Ornithobacterium rhinotracheale TaxID=28251 RepID=UPI0040368ACF